MGFLTQFRLFLWKNWILHKRHYVITFFEILLPTLFAILLVVIKNQGGSSLEDKVYHPDPTFHRPSPVNEIANYGFYNWTLLYTPDTPQVKKIVESVKGMLEANGNYTIVPVPNEATMEKLADIANANDDLNLFGGVSFVDFPVDGSLPKTLYYRIRLRYTTAYPSRYGSRSWSTSQLISPFLSNRPPQDYSAYDSSNFLPIQHKIATEFVRMVSGSTLPEPEFSDIKYTYQLFPYPPYEESSSLEETMRIMVALLITLSYIFTAPTLIKRIIIEKEEGIKELMKLMGLPGWVQWTGWFVSYFIIMSISALFITALLCISFGSSGAIYEHSAFEAVLFLMLLYVASSILFCFFISSLFSRPTLGLVIGVCAWVATFAAPYFTMGLDSYDTFGLSAKLSVALFPNMAMGWTIRTIISLESSGKGLQWNNFSESAYKGENLTTSHLVLMYFIDIFLYAFLTWYFDNVLPGKYGIRKPWYFLLTKSYWIKPKAKFELDNTTSETNGNFEQEPTDLTPRVVIKNLTKCYGWSSKGKRAVDNLSLNFYEGQITALLGHNGAGKTTTMSVLTGMFAPTSGTAMINGFDIRDQIDLARENLGLCPQHNMLFDILTVKEHLLFFGKLKNSSGEQLEQEVNTLMNKLQLSDKGNTPSKSLSGGMKRKLNLGIALVGAAKVVMLDEPTSGMDPEARRAIWDLLQELRPGRCIVLTTHFMEEADVLGDRIAIMAHGQAQCFGTPLFLKKKFGAGYHLNISKNPSCKVPDLTAFIKNFIPEASLDTNVSNELSFILPSDKSNVFPDMFEKIEKNTENLGINNFGVSVTTMEEVFLKVGEMVDENMKSGSTCTEQLLIEPSVGSNTTANTGFNLMFQQYVGLFLKRFFYYKRRWILLLCQILLPVFFTIFVLSLTNSLNSSLSHDPPLKMDLNDYKIGDHKTIVAATFNSTDAWRAPYKKTLPSFAELRNISDIDSYLIKVGTDNLRSYRDDHVVAVQFVEEETGKLSINAMYNGIYQHAIPLSVNLVHKALLNHYKNDGDIIVENAPLPSPDQSNAGISVSPYIIGSFFPIGLSFLSASFVLFIIHERLSKSKHLQMMSGISGLSFWGSAILWDKIVYVISVCLMVIVFATMDSTDVYSNHIGIVFLMLFLYGLASIPFSYMISFMPKTPSGGFLVLFVINFIGGLTFGMPTFIFDTFGTDGAKAAIDILAWFFYLLPSCALTVSMMKLPILIFFNSACDKFSEEDLAKSCNTTSSYEIKRCCPDCVDDCFVPYAYFGNSAYGLLKPTIMLVVDGVLYLSLLVLIESGLLYRFWYALKSSVKNVTSFKGFGPGEASAGLLDPDVVAEQTRIQRVVSERNGGMSNGGIKGHSVNNGINLESGDDDVLVVHKLLKRFFNLSAVNEISFGVKGSECFGLLGVNGAGKTTTFRMLTGDEVITGGDAFMSHISLKTALPQFLQQINYCPQFDALIDHMTGRETLMMFARLRGIPERSIVQTVYEYINMFDLMEHADKITMAYSGGNKRKLSTAIAFLGKPKMVFLDEPTTGVDPVARRKIWDILLEAKSTGTSIILTSHSMEECEVLCSRLAIMVNGQFKCLGGIQHLKSKFGQGFTIMAKVGQTDEASVQQQLQFFISSKFPSAVLKDVHQGLVHYHVTDPRTTWRYLFSVMEEAKAQFNIEDYSVSQTSLEQVFLSFAREQRAVPDQSLVNVRA